MESTLFLYIGPPKTASTFLQRGFLQKIDELECRIRPRVQVNGRELMFSDLFFFFPEVWRGIGKDYLERWAEPALRQNRDLVISSEGIYGGLATPRPWYPSRVGWLTGEVNGLRETNGLPSHHSNVTHLQAIADTASELGFSETKILVTIRRQDTKLASGYAEMSSSIANASQTNFENWVEKLLSDPVGRYALGGKKLNYGSWWRQVTTKFSSENILLLPMELLGTDQNEFLGRWLDFLGLQDQRTIYLPFDDGDTSKRKSSVSDKAWLLRPPARDIRALPFRILRKIGLVPAMKRLFSFPKRDEFIRLTNEISDKVLAYYKQSNQDLDTQIDEISLQRFGYY
jgi:hypothetical protein